MTLRFDMRRLFEPWRYSFNGVEWPYTYADIAQRTKALDRQSFSFRNVREGAPWFIGMLELAFKARVPVVLRPFESWSGGFSTYAMQLDQAWRIHALEVLWAPRKRRGWSRADEAQESLLLGYPPDQVRRWINRLDQRHQPAQYIYALLDRSQRRRVIEYGHHCFGPPAALRDLRLASIQGLRMVRLDAFQRVPRGYTLARLAVAPRTLLDVYGEPKPRRPIAVIEPTAAQARAIITSSRSDVHFLTAKGWVGPDLQLRSARPRGKQV